MLLLNILKIKKKIDYTVNEIIKFNPDILFSVDSPDFTLRVSEKVKKKIKILKLFIMWHLKFGFGEKIELKKLKKFIDHILLLFDFEKKYFDEENIKNTFVGHPLIEKIKKLKIDISNISKGKKIISIFPGSRKSEINVLFPIFN